MLQVDLTARIREILRNYPEGTSIFKELIQNADDAGAREVSLAHKFVSGERRAPDFQYAARVFESSASDHSAECVLPPGFLGLGALAAGREEPWHVPPPSWRRAVPAAGPGPLLLQRCHVSAESTHGHGHQSTPLVFDSRTGDSQCGKDSSAAPRWWWVRFTEVDFQSIQRIGDSLKKEDSKGTKTGRFGEPGI